MSAEEFDMSHRSQFEAPPYSIADVRHEWKGNIRVTTVIMDGEIQEFEIRESTWRAAASLAQQKGSNE